MKRFYTILASAALAMTSTMSADKLPVIYSADFDIDGVYEQWTQFGLGRTLIDNTQVTGIWGLATSKPYMMITANNQGWAASTSNFTDVETNPADEWLISPKITIPYDNVMVSYKAFSTNVSTLNTYNNQFVVKVSDKGNQKTDFPDTNISQGELNLKGANYTAPLSGYKDKEIYLALVNISNRPGVLGFNNIDIMQYYINVENNTAVFSVSAPVKLTVQMRTPVACKGFKATLKSSTGVEDVYESNSELSEYLQTFNITFNKPIELSDDVLSASYTVTITPNFEGAIPTEIEGSIENSITYTKKVVVEEGTSTGCGYCPRGAVSLDMWHQIYGMQVIPIAVHSHMSSVQDPMYINGGAYLRGLGISGLPGGRYNRKPGVTAGFMSPEEIVPYLEEVATAQASFNMVEYDPNTRVFKVNYLARMGYANNTKSLSMAAVLIEDNVSSTNSNYKQSNYYSRTPQSQLVQQYGEEWWPAWQKYAEGPSYIAAKNMVYNHVARGIYPSFSGQPVSSEWERDKDIAGTIEFTMPTNVMDEEQTTVAILLLDDKTGEIVGADYVSYADYNRVGTPGNPLGVSEVEASAIRVDREGSDIRVAASTGATVDVYSVDGAILASRVMDANEAIIEGNFAGVVIVKVRNGKASTSHKLVF